ncbi:LTA synthase family protein [Flavobacterium proteolyticum]|uniref:Sulfatase-like hydrolase/transferase n=1 Tax=Flavobacterium proteolyticum TaxID=2911683 RepID=A0ABR9WS88_9FLAO|nr:alkaline phosphatase family protein [Flavobacterium proteolyticum]MBE9576675.1 sulfatase-like hydrolase/transferase [Flavobacterium proteolyticum]
MESINNISKRYSLLLGFSAWFILFSFLLRIVFLFWQLDEIEITVFNLLKILSLGLLFDVGVLSFLFVISTFYILLIPKRFIGSKVDKIFIYLGFLLTLLIFVFTFFAEITFWEEFKCRFNFVAVDYLIYTFEVVQNIHESYPLYILIPSMLIITGVIYFYFAKNDFFNDTFTNKISFKSRILPFVISLTVMLIYVFFVSNSNAEWSKNRYNNEISKTGIYSFFAELRNNKLDFKTFYNSISDEEAFQLIRNNLKDDNVKFLSNDYSIKRKITDSLEVNTKPNVVFILIESMSASFMAEFGNEKKITPFLDSIANKSLFFKNLQATGNRTVRGMEAVTLSIPPTPGQSIVKRPNNSNLYTISNVFKSKNYQCNFFYGGDGYFDNMNAFYGGNGFDIYDRGRGSVLSDKIKTTRHNIDDSEVTFENAWGICDEDIYNKMIKVADEYHQKKKPFLNFVMTTSNHRPYTYPDNKIDIPSGKSRSGAVKYSDYALQQMFKKAKNKPWFKNTIFVFVADHCASSAGKDEIDVANYHIPAIIYGENLIQPQKVTKLCSQIDIFPTLFGQLHWSYTSNFFGTDVLSKKYQERALMGTYLKLALQKDKIITILSNKKTNTHYNWNETSNKLKVIPVNKFELNETISWYQTADYLYLNNKLN